MIKSAANASQTHGNTNAQDAQFDRAPSLVSKLTRSEQAVPENGNSLTSFPSPSSTIISSSPVIITFKVSIFDC